MSESARETFESSFYWVILVLICAACAGAWWLAYWLTGSSYLDEWTWARPVIRWAVGLLAIVVGVATIIAWIQGHQEGEKERRKEKEADLATRKSSREEIRHWCSHIDEEYAWLLETPWDDQEKWAVRRFVEVVKDWREENARFSVMKRNEHFDQAFKEVGAPAERMLTIWNARRKLYQWARVHVTPVERVESGLNTSEQIAKQKVKKQDEFNAFRSKRLGGGIDEDDDEDVR